MDIYSEKYLQLSIMESQSEMQIPALHTIAELPKNQEKGEGPVGV